MGGENLDPLLQKPLSKASILSCRSEKTVLNFFTNLFKIGSHTPLYYKQIIKFTICLIINQLNPLSLTAMPFRGVGGPTTGVRTYCNTFLPVFTIKTSRWRSCSFKM
jgi:hypothetical protein